MTYHARDRPGGMPAHLDPMHTHVQEGTHPMTTKYTQEIRVPLEAAQIAMSADVKLRDSRPVLACVHLDIKNGIIAAADGFRMAHMDWQPESVPEGFPDSILLPADTVIAFARQAKRGETHFFVSLDTATKQVAKLTMLAKSGGRVSQVVQTVQGTYPDVRQIYPQQEAADIFSVSPDQMIKIMQAYKRAGAKSVRMQRYPQGEHVTFHANNTGAKIDSMLMLMVVSETNNKGMVPNLNPLPQDKPAPLAQAAD